MLDACTYCFTLAKLVCVFGRLHDQIEIDQVICFFCSFQDQISQFMSLHVFWILTKLSQFVLCTSYEKVLSLIQRKI